MLPQDFEGIAHAKVLPQDFEGIAHEKCSWWRLDGYDTCGSEAEESDEDPQVPLDEEMDIDSEEEGHRSDIELSISDSD